MAVFYEYFDYNMVKNRASVQNTIFKFSQNKMELRITSHQLVDFTSVQVKNSPAAAGTIAALFAKISLLRKITKEDFEWSWDVQSRLMRDEVA